MIKVLKDFGKVFGSKTKLLRSFRVKIHKWFDNINFSHLIPFIYAHTLHWLLCPVLRMLALSRDDSSAFLHQRYEVLVIIRVDG